VFHCKGRHKILYWNGVLMAFFFLNKIDGLIYRGNTVFFLESIGHYQIDREFDLFIFLKYNKITKLPLKAKFI
jgi:hypothetical protein